MHYYKATVYKNANLFIKILEKYKKQFIIKDILS